jgi:glycosyltransferase involved in cell wall biosynthesis
MFFASENVDDLAKRMLLLIRDQQLRQRLVARASEYVQENNWRVKKREYLELVDSLTSPGTRRVEERVPMAA